jgi:hypothetical protein
VSVSDEGYSNRLTVSIFHQIRFTVNILE